MFVDFAVRLDMKKRIKADWIEQWHYTRCEFRAGWHSYVSDCIKFYHLAMKKEFYLHVIFIVLEWKNDNLLKLWKLGKAS